MPWYIGLNCSSKSPYPSYGIHCQGFCNCHSNQCDASKGCNTQASGNFFSKGSSNAYLTINS